MAKSDHHFKFSRTGGVDQVMLRCGTDITNLNQLDQKLWVALACPTRGLDFDTKTLDFIDTDKDGRIRVPEVLAAVAWVGEVLKDPELVFKGGDTIPLSAINDRTEAGAALLAGARRLLHGMGKPDEANISLAEAGDQEKIFAQTRFNGDGVVSPDVAEDEATRKTIEDILTAQGSVKDRGGKPGVDQALLDAFFTGAETLCAWARKAEQDPALRPAGEATSAAFAATEVVRAKVDDYFARCRLAAFDPRAAALLNGTDADFAALHGKVLSAATEEVARLPLAAVAPGKALPLSGNTNPAWAAALATFHKDAARPLLGSDKASLTEAEWEQLKGSLGAYGVWTAERPQAAAEKLGLVRLRELCEGGARERIAGLIQQDAALGPEVAQFDAVHKLLLFQRDLVRLLDNYVNFSEFYGRRGAVFQAGTLYLDGRACELCVHVDDPGKHGQLAGLAKTYLAYCDCTRPGGEKMTIAAAFTNGDSDNLMAGRNGVFYDRKGRDWDATITKIVENPISIRQAFWAPYKNFVRMIEAQVSKRAAAADAEATAKLQSAATSTAHADRTKEPPMPEAKKIDIGTVAAIGVAIGGIATFFSSILATFFGLGRWMPAGFLVLVLAISGPSMLIAWLKLRQRNLGPILDANGWAVNGRMKINVPFGRALTGVAALPKGARRSVRDPYAEKGHPWKVYLLLLIFACMALLWYQGKLDPHLPGHVRSDKVLHG